MDGLDLFRKLGVGAKFNFNRFQRDAEKLRIIKPKAGVVNDDKLNSPNPLSDATVGEVVTQVGHGHLKSPTRPVKDASLVRIQPNKRRAIDDDHSDMEIHDDQTAEPCLLGSMKSQSKAKEDGDKLTRSQKKKRKKQRKDKSEMELHSEAKQEQVNRYRNVNRIHVYGSDVPDPIQTFDDFQNQYNLNQVIVSNVKSLGFEEPTPIQMQAIPVMMHGREILACAPTGSGKTLAFILPILHQLKCPQNKGFRALVLSPTRELASQTHKEFQRIAEGTGFRIHIIENANKAAKKFGTKTAQKFDILVTTPNRLIYMLKQDPPTINLGNIEWLVVDESDKLFEDGKTGFRDQLATIYKSCDSKNARRAMFSATFAFEVEEWCKLNLESVVQVYVGAKNAATDTVEQQLLFVGSESGKLIAFRDLVRKGIQPPVLVFVQSKERAKELFHELIYDGINVDVIHAERTQVQRDNVVKQFRAGKIWILICTELMGRGMDFKGVNLVINYDFPTSSISYIHRIGRTGRAGRNGKAVTYFTENDATNLRSIANVMRQAGCVVPEYMLKLKKLEKHERKKYAKSVPKRHTIRTIPKNEIIKARQRRKKISKSKQEKHKANLT